MAAANDSNTVPSKTEAERIAVAREFVADFMRRWPELDAKLVGARALIEAQHTADQSDELTAAGSLLRQAMLELRDLADVIDGADLQLHSDAATP